uniref:Uncharacterized protein AlNc14C98G5961 n=1 Tax=Albugo laibachii Nc14 TaxID=890382 RepID=F0WH96_9STRA|nr:conserved hypothetical protein [Albugo laibachii Nc14]|eukprot:CCA20611.1 conserved hypothetical protein [Albugo laibachii Nc14]
MMQMHYANWKVTIQRCGMKCVGYDPIITFNDLIQEWMLYTLVSVHYLNSLHYVEPAGALFSAYSTGNSRKSKSEMFVLIQSSDNPWLVAVVVLVQILIPMLENGMDIEFSSVYAAIVIALLLLLLILSSRLLRFIRSLYLLRNEDRTQGWREYFARAYRHSRQPLGPNARRPRSGQNAQHFDKVMRTIQAMPLEEFKTFDELQQIKIAELKERLLRRGLEVDNCIERQELVERLTKFRGGPVNNNSCSICCEEYQTGDILRLLQVCKHEFHLECLDRWILTTLNTERSPTCPLCNQSLG